ncbi:MAG TPA: hypothetical protein EYN67_14215 [Flavobacteriales bacterium]|nr:hypothetical protein [Flavobacteriales bacterium]
MNSTISVNSGQHQNTVSPSVYNPTETNRTPYRWSEAHDGMRYNQHPKNCYQYLRDLPACARDLYRYLCDKYNFQVGGGNTYPLSDEWIAEENGWAVSTAARARKILKEKGLLDWSFQQRANGFNFRVTTRKFKVLIPEAHKEKYKNKDNITETLYNESKVKDKGGTNGTSKQSHIEQSGAINDAVNGPSLFEDGEQVLKQTAQNATGGSTQNYAEGQKALNIDIESVNDQKKSEARNTCSYSSNETTNNSCELLFDLEQYTNAKKVGQKQKKGKFDESSHRIFYKFKSRFEAIEGIPLPKQRELGTRQMADNLYSYVARDCGLPDPMVAVVVDVVMKKIPAAVTPNFFLKAEKGVQALRDVVGFVREKEGLPPLGAERRNSKESHFLTEANNRGDESEDITQKFRGWVENNWPMLKNIGSDRAFQRAMRQDVAEALGEENVKQILEDFGCRR